MAEPSAPPPRSSPAHSSPAGNERRIPAAAFLTADPGASRGAPESSATVAAIAAPPALAPENSADVAQAELPPDAPIEPGAGPPRNRGGRSAAERIASSMAALGATPDKATPPTSSLPNFIVAARRAAQAASEQQSRTAAAAALADDAPGAIRQKLAQRVRSLFVSASVIMIGFGVAGIALSSADLLNFGNGRSTQRSATVAEVGPRNDPVPPAPRPSEEAAPGLALPKPFSAAAPVPERPGVDGAASNPLAANPGANAPAPAAPSTKTANADHTGSIPPLHEGLSAPATRRATARMPSSNPVWSDPIPAGIATKPLVDGIAAGNPAAAFEIASRYAEGRGAPADLSAAATWFARAAEAGLAPAQFRLGSMYEKGLGVKKDLAEARRLYLAAAAQGNASAMHNVAVLHAEGLDGKPDFAAAAEWFRKAAEYGVADSQYNLAVLYARGIGVEQNLAEAFKWFAIAGQKGDKDASKKSDDIGGRLAQPLLAAARSAASVFAPKLQPEEATAVPPPPGGWDDAGAAAPAKPKPRARNQAQQSARL
jgi:localization factor PodJL